MHSNRAADQPHSFPSINSNPLVLNDNNNNNNNNNKNNAFILEDYILRTNMNLSNILSSVKSNKKEYTVHGKQ